MIDFWPTTNNSKFVYLTQIKAKFIEQTALFKTKSEVDKNLSVLLPPQYLKLLPKRSDGSIYYLIKLKSNCKILKQNDGDLIAFR